MAMIKCKDCGKDISDNAERCPYCGAIAPITPKRAMVFFVCMVFLVMAVFMFFWAKQENLI